MIHLTQPTNTILIGGPLSRWGYRRTSAKPRLMFPILPPGEPFSYIAVDEFKGDYAHFQGWFLGFPDEAIKWNPEKLLPKTDPKAIQLGVKLREFVEGQRDNLIKEGLSPPLLVIPGQYDVDGLPIPPEPTDDDEPEEGAIQEDFEKEARDRKDGKPKDFSNEADEG